MKRCEECEKETDNLLMGACKECSSKIIEKIEKNIKYKKINFGEF
jgi:DNA-directed RNA polymerase subunit RPC12/RpoP